MSEPPVPAPPEPLLAPLLDAAADLVRTLDVDELPHGLRPLHAFRSSGTARGAARAQIRRALETEENFRKLAVDHFLDQPASRRALEGWTVGDAPALVADAAMRSDLPLLASALWAARPNGWAFGLGVVAAEYARGRHEREEEDELKALGTRVQQAEEAKRRAETARAETEQQLRRTERDLRDERASRRAREDRAQRAEDSAQRRVDELRAEMEQLRARADDAERRRAGAEAKAREVTDELRRARQRAGEPERVVLHDRDLDALVDAASLARRLADGLGGVADRVGRLRATGSAAGSARGGGSGGAGGGTRPARRREVRVPSGLAADAPEAIDAMLRTPGVVLVVDGYNVSMRAWPGVGTTEQRDRLVSALSAVHARTRCDITVVFDGSHEVPGAAQRRVGIRVLFSAAGEEADAVVVREVQGLPLAAPAVVVSSDGWVREHAEAAGATVVPTDAFLRALRA